MKYIEKLMAEVWADRTVLTESEAFWLESGLKNWVMQHTCPGNYRFLRCQWAPKMIDIEYGKNKKRVCEYRDERDICNCVDCWYKEPRK